MLGCLLGIFTVPYRFLKWCFTNGWKGIAVFIVAAVVIVVGVVMITNTFKKDIKPEPTKAEITIPTVKQAPYLVTTSSRYYYADKAVKDKDGVVTMTDYWELKGEEWVKQDKTLVLDNKYGEVKIRKR